jgi:hypothetical protein
MVQWKRGYLQTIQTKLKWLWLQERGHTEACLCHWIQDNGLSRNTHADMWCTRLHRPFISNNIYPSTLQPIIVPFLSHNMFRPYTAYSQRGINYEYTNILGNYTITHKNTHAAAQVNPNKETWKNVIWTNGWWPQAKYWSLN